MPPKPASKAYRDQQRERLLRLGVDGHQLIEQLMADLMGCGCRPREAWRLAHELTQDEVAARFNQIRNDPDVRMRGSRICEYEKWPGGGVRPSVRTLKILAAIYGTTWDRLVDVRDLEGMPARDRQAYLDISDLHHGDPLDLSVPRQRHGRSSAAHSSDNPQGDRPSAEESTAVREGLPVRSSGSSLSDSGITTMAVTSPEGLSEALYQALVTLDHGVRDPAGWRGPVWSVPPLRGDEIARPKLMEELVEAVTRPGVSAVGMTTGLWGAGGFGKTTMARLLAHHYQIRQHFPDGVVWVTVGEDAAGPELADKLTNVVSLLSRDRPAVTDPLAAGAELGRAVGDQRVLLIVDDVWTTAQVEPFLIGGPNAVRLFTSRIRGALPGSAELVRVDQMRQTEAQQLLTAGVAAASDGVTTRLMAVTGRWPVLLALVNGAVRADLDAGRQPEDAMREILQELGATGPTALDITDAAERHTAVARTIGVSLNRLTSEQRDRYLELAVFGEDVAIPGPVLARYWNTTGGWSTFATRRFCRRLANLALVSDYRQDPHQVTLHDVIRAYLREQTHHRHSELDRALIDAHRSLVGVEGGISAWWQLSAEQNYLWAWLPTHLRGAGWERELRRCLHHPKWLVGKLEQVGPAGLEADLALLDDPVSRAIGTAVRQNASALAPLHPPGSLAATLATRLPGDGPTTAIADQLIAGLTGPHLRAVTALPDLPHPALSWVLTGHTDRITTLEVAPEGSWLASASGDETVRIWDLVTGTTRHTLSAHTDRVTALTVAPDGSWLASASGDKTVRIWDPITGSARHTLTGHAKAVTALRVAPQGSWLASASFEEVRIWDPITGAIRHTLTGHSDWVTALAVAPDGSWLASASFEEVQIWDPIIGVALHTLTGHAHWVMALGVAPDGSWLASASGDKTVRIWDPATGATRDTLTGHTNWTTALLVAPDGSWLASASSDKTVRIWDPLTGTTHRALIGHTNWMTALEMAPDGSWLATGSEDEEVRIWDPITGAARHTLTGHTHRVTALVAAPDGSWLASASNDTTVRVWDPMTGTAHHTLTGHTHGVTALGVAPDGSWLASASDDKTVRIWDPMTGAARHTLTGHTQPVTALGVAPDGSWLASASGDETVQVWDPVTGTAHHTLTGHTNWVVALGVAPDGTWLASASGDKTVRIWDPMTGTARHPHRPHRAGADVEGGPRRVLVSLSQR